jgi:hypothetical protein
MGEARETSDQAALSGLPRGLSACLQVGASTL